MPEVQEIGVIDQTIEYVKDKLYYDSSGHDWWHVHRVWKMAMQIQFQYTATDKLVVELSALLHDIADWKTHSEDFKIGAVKAREWLNKLEGINSDQIDHICRNIENISFKGAKAKKPKLSLEGQIVQDADRLDAMGAIGIARTFAYGGKKGRLIYEPEQIQVNRHSEFSYVNDQNEATSIDHFYDKLLLIKDLMNTKYARLLAQRRHDFMINYLSQFYSECEGDI